MYTIAFILYFVWEDQDDASYCIYQMTVLFESYCIWPDLWKQDTIAYFSNSCLLNIYNLRSQVYPLAKFQLHMLITFGVTALQSSNNRKINMYSKYRENKLQALTKTFVTYQQIEVQSYTFHHCVCHEQGNQLLGKGFLYLPFFTAYKGEICEEKWRKQMLITYVSLGLLQQNLNFSWAGEYDDI